MGFCQRTFSSLRRIKTYLKNKISDDYLTNLAVINIETFSAKKLNLENVVDSFGVNPRRIILH